MDSDDQNYNKKCGIDDENEDVLVEYKVDTKCCDKTNGIAESQYLDANGNRVNHNNQTEDNEYVECDCVGVQIDGNTIIESNKLNHTQNHKPSESVMKKLVMSLTDDDYGECPNGTYF